MSENLHHFTVTLSLYDVVVNSVRYREDGHRDNWMIGDLYLKHQALPAPPPKRIEVTVSRFLTIKAMLGTQKHGPLAAV